MRILGSEDRTDIVLHMESRGKMRFAGKKSDKAGNHASKECGEICSARDLTAGWTLDQTLGEKSSDREVPERRLPFPLFLPVGPL